MADHNNIKPNLESYVTGFSENAREIFDKYDFFKQIEKLHDNNLLYHIVEKFSKFDLTPKNVSNHDMGVLFEELIRKFAEQSNETAGEHFTPRDIVRLTTSMLLSVDDDVFTKKGIIRSLYDPTAGTGGFLSIGSEYIYERNPDAKLVTFGQELNPESYAICKAEMMIKGQDVVNIKYGNTLSDDQLKDNTFDYMLSNPPFGVEWKKVKKQVTDEHKLQGYKGRFGAGLPRISDGSLLFLLHLISKMRLATEGGSRIGIILNGSPLFTGGAGSGESKIRRYILEYDLLEAIVAMPIDMFFNTGISTYIWILSNHKDAKRKGKVQLIDASNMGESMKKSLGSKRKYFTKDGIKEIVQLYGSMKQSKKSQSLKAKIFKTTDFGYRRITIERPLKLSYYPHDEVRIEALVSDKNWKKIDNTISKTILAILKNMDKKIPSKATFDEIMKTSIKKLKAPILKLLQKHLSEHDDNAEIVKDSKGNYVANADLRDYENVPLGEDINAYFEREVLPHVPLAWIDTHTRDQKDGEVGIVGYEIPFNRHFYEYTPPRDLEDIDAELERLNQEIMGLLHEI